MNRDMININIKNAKRCAFCKYWYDPTNSAIVPKSPKINMWQFNEKAKMKCLKKNFETKASAFCLDYECKLQIMK
ncbi:MAG: hypothetical protein HUJ70_07685 [Pseudobutyrivibrio sp.]|nr:hypothetical protein [Pseudobutyrivibrio sp.]